MTARCGVCCQLQTVVLLQHADAGAVLYFFSAAVRCSRRPLTLDGGRSSSLVVTFECC